ncbi:exodeoxyribonuclease VII small subunit [Alkalibacter rhizosphaerae]|uniref:Exodeoxyribonuclease 7 small subunit n=1 Tax=Alkalibacter rhizosphaerae TaxID=2815577 RepID=A0A974XFJ9_9FIRM|nr:exodeoxyribonuclease VII small subunit [Alkalibacter rhizosphaerae]QSX08937.1 exodeoxyribonuclease VII small subunit [Alkalibacter rhizosphaerae]
MKKQSYEDRVKRIEEIVKRIETNQPTMEESVALFEEGMELVRLCEEELESTQQKVVKLAAGKDGTIKEPFGEVDS